MSKEFYEELKRRKRRAISKEAFDALEEANRRQGRFSAEIRKAQKEIRDDLFALPPPKRYERPLGMGRIGRRKLSFKKETFEEADARVAREMKKRIEANRKGALVRQLVRRKSKQGAVKNMKKMYEIMRLVKL